MGQSMALRFGYTLWVICSLRVDDTSLMITPLSPIHPPMYCVHVFGADVSSALIPNTEIVRSSCVVELGRTNAILATLVI